MPLKSSSIGIADGVIIPIIIATHIRKVSAASAPPHAGRCRISMPIAAMAMSYSIPADISRSRRTR